MDGLDVLHDICPVLEISNRGDGGRGGRRREGRVRDR